MTFASVDLFVCTGDKIPNVFIKASSREEVLEKLHLDFNEEAWQERVLRDGNFRCRLVTWKLLMELTPDEFLIDEDTSF